MLDLFPCEVWQLGSSSPNFTLEGHEKGVNCIDYYSGGDKPYLISGADDRLVKIWDYQVQCVHLFMNTLVDYIDWAHQPQRHGSGGKGMEKNIFHVFEQKIERFHGVYFQKN